MIESLPDAIELSANIPAQGADVLADPDENVRRDISRFPAHGENATETPRVARPFRTTPGWVIAPAPDRG
jgi:hypothetical protein